MFFINFLHFEKKNSFVQENFFFCSIRFIHSTYSSRPTLYRCNQSVLTEATFDVVLAYNSSTYKSLHLWFSLFLADWSDRFVYLMEFLNVYLFALTNHVSFRIRKFRLTFSSNQSTKLVPELWESFEALCHAQQKLWPV